MFFSLLIHDSSTPHQQLSAVVYLPTDHLLRLRLNGSIDQLLRVEGLPIGHQVSFRLSIVMLQLGEAKLNGIELWAVADVVDALDLVGRQRHLR